MLRLQDLANTHKSVLLHFPAPHPSNCFLSGNHLQIILTKPPRNWWSASARPGRGCLWGPACVWVMGYWSWYHSCYTTVKAVLEKYLHDSAVSVKWFLQSPQKQPFRQHRGSPEIMCCFSAACWIFFPLSTQVRLPPNTNDEVDEDPTGNKALWDRGLLNGASQKVILCGKHMVIVGKECTAFLWRTLQCCPVDILAALLLRNLLCRGWSVYTVAASQISEITAEAYLVCLMEAAHFLCCFLSLLASVCPAEFCHLVTGGRHFLSRKAFQN